MATNVTEERIELTAVDKFSQVLGQAERQFRTLGSSIDTVKNLAAALGVTLGAGALAAMVAETVKATAALDDMAEQTGATVEGLSKIQTVAKIGGHEFGGVAEAMQKMVKGLKGTGDETVAASHALEFLGVKAKDANGRFRDTAEILQDVAKELVKYEDGGNKVALVQDLLGKGGARYLSLLKDMAEEGEQQAKVTAQQAAEAERFEKNLQRLKIAGDDMKREFVMGITPALVDFTEKLLDAQKASGGLIAGLATLGTASTGNIPARLAQIEAEIQAQEKNAAVAGKLGNFGGIGGLMARLGSYGSGVDVGRLMSEREYLLKRISRNAVGLEDDLSGTFRAPQAPTRNTYVSPVKGGGAGAGGDGEALIIALKDQLAAADGTASVFDSTMRKLTEGQKEYSHAVQATALALAGEIDNTKRAAAESKRLLDAIEQAIKKREEMDAVVQSLNSTLEQTIENTKFESDLVGADAATREKAVALRQVDLQVRQALSKLDAEDIVNYPILAEKIVQLGEARKQQLGWIVEEKVAREEADKAAREAARAWEDQFRRTSDIIQHSLTDALMRGFERGKSFGQNFVDVLKNLFKSLVLEPVIRPIAMAASGALLGAAGMPAYAGGFGSATGIGGIAGGAGGLGNLLSFGNSAYSAVSGNGILGGLFGGSSLGAIGAGLTDIGSLAGIDAIAGLGALGETSGLIASAAAPGLSLLGPIGLGIGALALAGGLFGGGGGPKTGEILLQRQNGRNPLDTNQDSSGLSFVIGNNNLGGDQSQNEALLHSYIKALNDPSQYDPAILAQFVGTTIPGNDAQSSLQQLLKIIAPAASAAQGRTTSLLGRLDSQGGLVNTLKAFQMSLATSADLSPLDQLAGARGQYEDLLARVQAGDTSAAPALTSSASQLLNIGRNVYASGSGFQSLKAEVTGALADVLASNQSSFESLAKDMPASILQGAADTVAAIKKTGAETLEALRQISQDLRGLRAA